VDVPEHAAIWGLHAQEPTTLIAATGQAGTIVGVELRPEAVVQGRVPGGWTEPPGHQSDHAVPIVAERD